MHSSSRAVARSAELRSGVVVGWMPEKVRGPDQVLLKGMLFANSTSTLGFSLTVMIHVEGDCISSGR